MKRLIVLVILLVAQASAQSQSIDSAQTDGLAIAPIAHRSAEAWGLSIDEWQRQTELRALSQGMLSQDLTPLEVLGILTDNPADRKRYARLYAEQQRAMLDRIAAFEADYLEEYAALNQRLSAGLNGRSTLVIDIYCVSTECIAQNGAVDIYVVGSAGDDAAVRRRQVAEALVIAQNGAVDIYVVGSAGDDAAVRKWAATNHIPPNLVRQRQITLNHGTHDMKRGLHQ